MDKTQYSHKWEIIKNGNVFMDRLKVPGGWLVQSMHLGNNCLTMCFYPDPEHKWDIPVMMEYSSTEVQPSSKLELLLAQRQVPAHKRSNKK